MRHGRKIAELGEHIEPERLIALIVGAEVARYPAGRAKAAEEEAE